MHVPATLPLVGLMTGNLPNPGLSAEAYLSARVFAPRIPRVPVLQAGTNVTLLPNALGDIISVPTVTVADAGGDTTTWPMIATSQTGNMTAATDGDLTYNAATGALTAVTFNGAFIGAATLVTVADESADTTCFPLFVTAATGDLGPKTNAALAFDSATGALTLGAADSVSVWTGRELDFTGANGTNTTTLYVANTTNTAVDAHGIITAGVGGTTSTGDPQFRCDIPGGTSWYMGADNDDSDSFKIGTGVAVGLNLALTITTALNATFAGTVASAGFSGNLTGNVTGDVTGNVSGNAGTVTVADAAADTTTWPLVAVNQTGSESPRTDAGYTYNASTGALTAVSFVGALIGNADTATSAATLTTPRTIGNVSFDGSANIVPETITSINEATDTSCFLLFITASGTQSLQPKNNTGLTYNSNTNNVGATTFTGALAGNATTATTATVGTSTTIANEATDTSCFINFTTAASGDLGVKTNANLAFNSNTGLVTFGAAVTVTGTLTLTGTAANIATGSNFISNAGTDAGLSFDASNNATLSADLTVGDDLVVNGDSITTDDTTFNIVNATVTTLNIGSASTVTRIGATTGKFGFGVASVDYIGSYFGQSITSGGASSVAAFIRVWGSLTGAAGDTTWQTHLGVTPVGTTTSGNTEVIASISSAYFSEPTITLGSGDTCTTAATVYIANAPTEGVSNYSLYVAAGLTGLNGGLSRTLTTQTGATYTVLAADTHIIANRAGTITMTLPTASAGRELYFLTIQAQTVVSASANVIPKTGAAASTAILPNTDGAWAFLVANGTNWQIMMSGT